MIHIDRKDLCRDEELISRTDLVRSGRIFNFNETEANAMDIESVIALKRQMKERIAYANAQYTNSKKDDEIQKCTEFLTWLTNGLSDQAEAEYEQTKSHL